jgi:hypothetical protein
MRTMWSELPEWSTAMAAVVLRGRWHWNSQQVVAAVALVMIWWQLAPELAGGTGGDKWHGGADRQ